MKKSKIVFYIIVPLALLILGIVCSLLFNSFSFSTLTYPHNNPKVIQKPDGYMKKNDKITLSFVSKENNLGVVNVNFEKYKGYNFIEEDRLIFRIREDSDNSWIYENIYGIGGYKKNFSIPFGFPLINDSKDKSYVVEIVSTAGQQSNSVILSDSKPILQSTYKFFVHDLLNKPFSLLLFLAKKFITSFTNLSFLYSSIPYFIPLFLYIFFMLFVNQKGIVRRMLFYLVLPILVMDSFMFSDIETSFVLLGSGIWVIAVYFYKFESSVSYLFSIIIVLLTIPAIILGEQVVVEKLSNYLYLFLVIGVVQSLLEFKHKAKRVNYKDFIKDIIKINGKS